MAALSDPGLQDAAVPAQPDRLAAVVVVDPQVRELLLQRCVFKPIEGRNRRPGCLPVR